MENCNGQLLVQRIEKTEAIGNSLDKINNNFYNLDLAICEMQTSVAWSAIPANSLVKVGDEGQLLKATENVDYIAGLPANLPAGILKRTVEGGFAIADSSDYVKPKTDVTFNDVTLNNAIINSSLACPSYKGNSTFEGEITFSKAVVAPNYVSISDKNLKENFRPLENSLEKLSKINGVYYDWKINSAPDVGVIAQEVQEVLPEAVYNTSNEFLGVTYVKLIPLLIESIKELKAEVDHLRQELKAKS